MKRLFVIKIGGNVIDHSQALKRFLSDIAAITEQKIIVHGGGKIATNMSAKLGIETRMVDGRRITDADTLQVVTMVYGGLINKTIVAGLQALGCNALGMTGADAGIIKAHKREHPTLDYGFVGDIDHVETAPLRLLLDHGITPVIAPLTSTATNDSTTVGATMLNTNADTMASMLASALAAEYAGYEVGLLYCFEKQGVLAAIDDEASVIPRITFQEYQILKERGVIAKGMLPKMENAFAALRQGVSSVRICHSEQIIEATQDMTTVGSCLSLE